MRNAETVEPVYGDPIRRSLSGRREYSEPGIRPSSETHRSLPAGDEIIISFGL